VQASSSAILHGRAVTWVKHDLLFALDDVVEELSALHVLHDEEELLGGLDDLVQLDDVGVPDEFEDVDLPRNPLHIRHVDYLLLLQYLYRHLFARGDVGRRFHLPESPLSQRFPWISRKVPMT
jgi:hypothetical protein